MAKAAVVVNGADTLRLHEKDTGSADVQIALLTKRISSLTEHLKGNSKEKCGHPSQKPIDLIEKLVACSTDAGDLVIDPFLGSGTTAAAAKNLNRQWIGIEKDAAYIQISEQRLAAQSTLFN